MTPNLLNPVVLPSWSSPLHLGFEVRPTCICVSTVSLSRPVTTLVHSLTSSASLSSTIIWVNIIPTLKGKINLCRSLVYSECPIQCQQWWVYTRGKSSSPVCFVNLKESGSQRDPLSQYGFLGLWHDVKIHIKILRAGISLGVQWLRFCLPMEGMQVQSMVRELRVTCQMAKIPEHKQQKQYCNKFNKDFKNGPHKIIIIIIF